MDWMTLLLVLLYLKLTVVCALLGALGGQHNIEQRRLGIPGVITLGSLLSHCSPWALLIMGMFGGMSIGYGLPDSTDKGSSLG